MNSPLFREEVLDSDHKRALGRVMMVHPLSHFALAWFSIGILISVIAALILCEYTRRAEVSGVLEPARGIVKLSASQNGRLKELLFKQGQRVKKGDILLIFTSEHELANGEVMEVNEEKELQTRLKSLRDELRESLISEEADIAALRVNLSNLLKSQKNLAEQIETQTLRQRSGESVLTRYKELRASGFFSDLQIQTKLDDVLDQKTRLQVTQNQLLTNAAEIARVERGIESSPSHRTQSAAQFARNISLVETELNKLKSAHEWSVMAPCDGIITALSVSPAQLMAAGTQLVTLIANDDELYANLYVPSRALGFVVPGKKTNIKLDAFPYQKFGMLQGHITSISGSPVLPSEVSVSTRLVASGMADEPMYLIKVKLDSQSIQAYGMKQALYPGIQVSAEIELDTRKLYEWVLEPLYR